MPRHGRFSSRALRSFVFLLAIVAIEGCERSPAPSAPRAPSAPPRPSLLTLPLSPGPSIPRQLAASSGEAFEIELTADQYLHATFEQQGVDLSIEIFAPGRRRMFHVDSPNGDRGPEDVHLVAEASGRYRFEVRAEPETPAGGYVPILRTLRMAEPDDRIRAAADRALYEAKEIDAEPGRFWEAVAKYEKSLLLNQEIGERWPQAYALLRLGRLYRRGSQHREALEYFRRAEPLFRAAGDLHFTTISLNESGRSFQDLADFEGASQAYQQALEMARRTGETGEQATSLHNLGTLYQIHGRPWQALGSFRAALEIWRRQAGAEARAQEAETLTGIGWVYTSTGDWQRAIDAHWRALRLRNRLGDRRLCSISLTQLGAVWLLVDPRRALPFLEKARALQTEPGAGIGGMEKAATLDGLGLAFRRLGRFAEAGKAYREALALYGSPPDPGGQAVIWINLGWTELDQNQPEQALKSFEQGLRLARQTRNPMAQSLALQGMAEAERGRGNVTLAQLRAEESLKIVESLRSAVARPDLQTSYLAANRNAYSLLIRCLMERHRQQPGGGFDLQALNRSEQARARVLLDALRESRELRADLRSHVPSELLAQRRDLLAAIGAEEAQRRRPGASPAETATAEQALAASLDRLSEIDTAIRRHRRGDRPFGLPSASVAEQRRQLLDENTLLLEYHLGTPHSHLWAVSIDGVQSFELPGRETLEPLLRSAYEQLAGLSAPDSGNDSRLLQLSRLLLGPVAGPMRGKRLLIAADGTQQYIPFAALPAPGGRHEPLLLEHEVVYIPSLAVLAELRGRNADRQPPPRTLAILADPVFDASDERLPQAGPVRQDVDEDRFLPRLLSSRDEAEAIARLLPAGEALAALDFDASRDLVTGGELSRYRILHFATHGFQHTDHPELSALVLSRFDRQGTPREGYLRVSDLAGLDLPADLVVLSACETALGQQAPGEGLVGLPQAFLAAGAQRILVSLWEVGDESTAALMEQFYRRLLIDHQPAGRALREAQLAIRAQPRWRASRYWAGFVLQGDWR